MSTELGSIQDSGSRNVELFLTQFWGGLKNGICLQLTAQEELEGRSGYVQLNTQDMKKLIPIFKRHIKAERIRKRRA